MFLAEGGPVNRDYQVMCMLSGKSSSSNDFRLKGLILCRSGIMSMHVLSCLIRASGGDLRERADT